MLGPLVVWVFGYSDGTVLASKLSRLIFAVGGILFLIAGSASLVTVFNARTLLWEIDEMHASTRETLSEAKELWKEAKEKEDQTAVSNDS
jgi:hypothetical protein